MTPNLWGDIFFSVLKSVFILLLASPFAFAAGPKCLKRTNAKQPSRTLIAKHKIDSSEVLARLVFAEGLSTNFYKTPNCDALGPEIFSSIAWGVMNRVRMGRASVKLEHSYGKAIEGVVFKRGQFNPAVSLKSKFSQLFLCPTSQPKWETYWPRASESAEKAINSPRENPFLQTEWEKKHTLSLVSHFYYPQSDQATPKPPKWADTSATSKSFVRELTINKKTIPHECIWFFRHEEPFEVKYH